MDRPTSLWETIKFGLIALVIVIPIRLFIAQPFIVSGASMDATFTNGQYLIVDELSFRLSEPARGQVVIFKYPNDPTKYFIKRIIGLPNDTIEIKEGVVTIKNGEHPDGFVLDEPYVENKKRETATFTLQGHQYFVMGDNRRASSDSRVWGPVDRGFIIGTPFVRLYPLTTLDILPGIHHYVQTETEN